MLRRLRLRQTAAVVLTLAAGGFGQAWAQRSDMLTANKIACTAETAKRCSADGKCVQEGTPGGKKDVMVIDFGSGRADMGEAIVNVQVRGGERHFEIGRDGKVKATLTRGGKLTVVESLPDGARIIAEATCLVRS